MSDLEKLIAEERKKLGIDLSSSNSSAGDDLASIIQLEREKYKIADENKKKNAAAANQQTSMQSQSTPTNMTSPKSDTRNNIEKGLDWLFKNNSVAKVINYPFMKAVEYATPNQPYIGSSDPNNTPRQNIIDQNKAMGIDSTGNATYDKIGDFAGKIGSIFTPIGTGGALINDIGKGASALLGTKTGQAIEAAAGKLGARAAGAVNPALNNTGINVSTRLAEKAGQSFVKGATLGAGYGAVDPFLFGEGNISDVPKSVAENALMFGAGDAALPFAGAGLSALGNKIAGTKLGNAVGSFLGRNKATVQETPQQTLALPPASPESMAAYNKRNGNVLPPNMNPIYARGGEVKPLALPEGNYVQPKRLKILNGEDSFNRVVDKIFPVATERLTPPLENPNELAKWVRGHLNDAGHDVSLNEVRKLNYEDLLQLADEMKPRINVADTVRKTAYDMGYGKIFDQTNPTIRLKLANDLKSQVYGVPAQRVNIAKPDSFNITHENPVASPETQVKFTQPKAASNKTVDKPLNIDSQQPQPIPVNQNVNVPQGTQAMLTSTPAFRQPGTTTKEITRKQVVDNIRKNLGVIVRTGRLGKVDPAVKGLFKIDPEVIRTRQASDIQVISHEVGHALEKKHPLVNPQFDAELMPLGQVTSASNYTVDQIRSEGIGEYIRTYLTDPAEAMRVAPNYSRYLETVLPKDVQNALKTSQADIATWIDQGAALQFRGQINRTGNSVKTTITQKFEKLYTQFVDRLYPIAKVEKAVTGKINDAVNSIYKKARRSTNVPKRAELMLQEVRDILKPLDDLGYTTQDVGDFAAAKQAIDIETIGLREDLQKQFPNAVIGYNPKTSSLTVNNLDTINLLNTSDWKGLESGFSLDRINAVLTKFDTPEMNLVQRQIVGYSNKLLDMLVQGQIVSPQSASDMIVKYPNHVPFYRYFDEDLTGGLSNGGSGFADLTNPIKRLKGSSKDVIDPLESIIKNTFAVVNAVEKNKVGLELANLSKFDGAGKFVERLDGKESVRKENIVTVFENGEKVQYQLDPDFYRAIKNLDQETTNTFIKILSIPASVLRAGATLTPEFIIRNPIRDQYTAFVTSEYGYNPLIDLPTGLWNVIFKNNPKLGKYYNQWVEAGGGFGNYVSGDRNVVREQLAELKKEGHPLNRTIKAVVNPKQWYSVLQKISEATEEATKVGEFRNAIKQGATPQEAAYQAADLMDFSRAGSSVVQANKIISFLNPNIQGKDRLARAFINHPVRTTVRAVEAVTLPTIGAYIMYKTMANDTQKETINNAPQWLKDTFFLIPVPKTDVVIRIPKPFDLAPIFSNMPEQIMRFIDKNDPETMDEFIFGAAKQQFEIPLMMSGIKPVVENWTNYKFFTDSPVVPKRDQDLLPQDQYDPIKTSLTARTIGDITGTSPYKVDNLISGYGAGLAKYGTNLIVDPLISATTGISKPPAADKNLSEQAFFNSFTVSNTTGGKVMDDFYKALEDRNTKAKSAERNKVTYDAAPLAKALNKMASDIGKIRNIYRDVSNSYDFTSTEKRQKLNELNSIMNEYAKRGLEMDKGFK